MKNKKLSNLGFHLMNFTFIIADLFQQPDKKLEKFNIKAGNCLVDFGCGPGRYVQKAAKLVGKTGKVYAVDIHEKAIDYVNKKIKTKGLDNVIPDVLNNGKSCVPEKAADIIYALDMFHDVSESQSFLEEIYRICQPSGIFYLEYGHQSKTKAIDKVRQSGYWHIKKETAAMMVLTPKSEPGV